MATEGLWRLRTPIDVQATMPGEKQKVLSLNVKGLYIIGWGTWIVTAHSDIILYGDGAEIFRYNNLTHENNKWADNPLTVNKMIDKIRKLDIALYQIVDVNTGYYALHDADITISCEYYTDEPPSKGDIEVTVIDAEKRTPIKNINVRIMAGARVVRDGYTDRTGKILFKNVDEGSYVLHIAGIPPTYWSGGYQGLDLEITVEPNVLNSYTAELPPLSRIPLPWYAYAGIAAAAIGGIYLITKPRQPQIMVVRD